MGELFLSYEMSAILLKGVCLQSTLKGGIRNPPEDLEFVYEEKRFELHARFACETEAVEYY